MRVDAAAEGRMFKPPFAKGSKTRLISLRGNAFRRCPAFFAKPDLQSQRVGMRTTASSFKIVIQENRLPRGWKTKPWAREWADPMKENDCNGCNSFDGGRKEFDGSTGR